MSYFEHRATQTDQILTNLTRSLRLHLGIDADRIIAAATCLYAVGSGGRGEMSAHSDVDLFVARPGRVGSTVDVFQIQQAIARALSDLHLPAPSLGGEYLKMHTAEDLCNRMGTPADDSENTFTARMLLVLESRVLLGEEAYAKLVARVVDAYWKDDLTHPDDYQPFVLVNDIVRFWRILLLNYVAKNSEKERAFVAGGSRANAARHDAERKLRSYKLRFSRCMTCFSALASLLSATAAGAVTKEHVLGLVNRRPVERLQAVSHQSSTAEPHVSELLRLYETFLRNKDEPEETLVDRMIDPAFASARVAEGRRFGDTMFDLLQTLGTGVRARTLFRHMVV